MVMRMGYSDNGEYDSKRNFTYSNKGTYGTAGFLNRKELKGVLDLVPDIRKHHGTILGELDGQVVCIPEKLGSMGIWRYMAPPVQKDQGVLREHDIAVCCEKIEHCDHRPEIRTIRKDK